MQRFYVNHFTQKPVYVSPTEFSVGEAVVSEVTRVEGSGQNDKQMLIDTLESAGGKGLRIIFTEDERNCGAYGNHEGEYQGGCFDPATPDSLYISEHLNDGLAKYVLLHEYAHYLQYINGLPFNECEADMYAVNKTQNRRFAAYLNKYDCSQAASDEYLAWL